MIQFEVDKQLLGDFQFPNELDLDARRVARRWPNRLRPARRADRGRDRLLRHGWIDRRSELIAGHVEASNATSGNARFISCRVSA